MDDNFEQQLIDFLSKHILLTLATVSDSGVPLAHTVTYVSEGVDIYFMTFTDTRKVQNIIKNSNIAYTVDEGFGAPIQGLQVEGKANIIYEKEELQKAINLLVQKFPRFGDRSLDPSMVIIKLMPENAYLLKGYRKIDKLTFRR